MVRLIFLCTLALEILTFAQLYAEDTQKIQLRYKPRLQEAMYTYYSKSETLFTNGKYQKLVSSNSQAYVGMRTLETLENGYLVQRAGVHAGNVQMNDQVYSHPALGRYIDYVLTPIGGLPKAIGNGNQFQVKDLQLIFPQEAVSVGHTWTVTHPSTLSFPVETKTTYEIGSILGSLVIINAKVNVDKVQPIAGLEFTIKGSSQIIFNADEGLLIRNESNQYLEISRNSAVKGKDSEERSTKMNVNSILELQF